MIPGMTCYEERSRLLAWIASYTEAYLYEDPSEDEGFRTVVSIRVGERMFGWHIADADVALFDGIAAKTDNHFDGHTTQQKYDAIAEEVADLAAIMRGDLSESPLVGS